mgnify:FL=1
MAQWKGSTQRGYRGRHRVRPGRVIPGHVDLSTRWGRPTTLSKTHPAPREASASADTTDTGSGAVSGDRAWSLPRSRRAAATHTNAICPGAQLLRSRGDGREQLPSTGGSGVKTAITAELGRA